MIETKFKDTELGKIPEDWDVNIGNGVPKVDKRKARKVVTVTVTV